MSWRRLLPPLLAASLAACASSAPLRDNAPGSAPSAGSDEAELWYAMERAEAELKRHPTTYSIKTATECDELGRKSAMAAQLPARGGPCIFGKIPVGTDWLGGRTYVILQLVFTPDGRLADGNFEEIRSLR